jgi:hypothetical protein
VVVPMGPTDVSEGEIHASKNYVIKKLNLKPQF